MSGTCKCFKISEFENGLLSISIGDVLEVFTEYVNLDWGLLWIEGMGNSIGGKTILELEEEINGTCLIVSYSLSELIAIIKRFD